MNAFEVVPGAGLVEAVCWFVRTGGVVGVVRLVWCGWCGVIGVVRLAWCGSYGVVR